MLIILELSFKITYKNEYLKAWEVIKKVNVNIFLIYNFKFVDEYQYLIVKSFRVMKI